MGIGDRAATCTSCGKRLNRKQWYYRNGKYFCKKRCWVIEGEKAATAAPQQKEAAPAKGEQPEATPSAAPQSP